MAFYLAYLSVIVFIQHLELRNKRRVQIVFANDEIKLEFVAFADRTVGILNALDKFSDVLSMLDDTAREDVLLRRMQPAINKLILSLVSIYEAPQVLESDIKTLRSIVIG